jgi:Mrp family chromosome partitioning ATPase
MIFKPDYPEMTSLRRQLDNMKEQLRDEIEKAIKASETEYRATQKKETELWRLLEGQRRDVVSMNNNAILYNSLKIEVENKRNLLNSLVAKQNETLVSARLKGLKSSNIKIIDSALIPGGPYSPNTRRNLMVGLLLGLMCGIGLAFFIDYLDNTIKSPEDTERLVELPSLGVIPFISPDGMKRGNGYSYAYSYGAEKQSTQEEMAEIKEIELINHKYPKLSVSEDYRTIRTSILFSHADEIPKAIAFSSAMPEEGKTATAINTAVSFAQLEKNILLIDADMRKPRLHKVFKARNIKGLSSYLTGKVSFEDAVQNTSIDRLHLMPSGPHPPNPAELLNSKRMRVLIEASKKSVGKTTRKALVSAVRALAKGKTEILGLVYNEMKIKGRGPYSPDHHGYLNTYYESPSSS